MPGYTAEEVEKVRCAVRQAIREFGLRPTARAAQMSAAGLGKFATSRSLPYGECWIGLREWFDAWSCGDLVSPDPADLRQAIAILTHDLEPHRERVRAELLMIMERFYRIRVSVDGVSRGGLS